jgi:hypothetical protein
LSDTEEGRAEKGRPLFWFWFRAGLAERRFLSMSGMFASEDQIAEKYSFYRIRACLKAR